MRDIKSYLSAYGPFILLFHGVVKENDYEVRNCICKHIEQDYFASLLKTLKANGTALSMDDIVAYHENGEPYPPNAFAVTFDDGFENNHSVAAPILADLNIPAAFYITTDFIANGTMSWTDKIEYCLEINPNGQITLPWEKTPRSFHDADSKIELMSAIRKRVFSDNTIDVHIFVEWFYGELNTPTVQTTDDPLDKKMNWEQVRAMHKHPLFTIGGHTHTHIVMSFVPENEMQQEIDLNLSLLKEKSGVETRHYAYPQGQENHYNQSVINALKARDIVCCPTAIDGQNKQDTGLFDLYRTMIV